METDLDKSSRDKAIKMLNLSKLQVACSKGDVGAVTSLLERVQLSREASSSPFKEDVYLGAHLPIHTACQRREACKEVIQVLLRDGGYLISDKTVNGDTALHVACSSCNLEAVRALVGFSESTAVRDCLRHQNRDGDTPFHLASKSGNHEVLKLLLEQLMPCDFKQVVSRTNRLGETSIGLATSCRDWTSIKLLLKHSQTNPVSLYSDFIKLFPECSLIKSLQAFEHQPNEVFLVGDTKSGKSSLVSIIQYTTQSILSKFVASLSRSAISESFEAGITPTTVEFRKQDHRCPLTFYDITGHRSYSQEAIFKCSRDPLEALYVITVDVRRNVEESILYWLNFLHHQLLSYWGCVPQSARTSGKMKVKVAIAGTFCDSIPSSRLQTAASRIDFSSIIQTNEDLASHFIWCGDFNLNTRKHGSLSMPNFLTTLHDQCTSFASDELKESRSLLAETYILASILLKEYPITAVAPFSDVIGLVQRSNHPLCKMLPKLDEEIEKLCLNLRYFHSFKVFVFDTSKGKSSHCYIVLDHKYLLESVKQALLALSQTTENGIVTRQQIKGTFNYHPDFIIRYLERTNLCEYISRKGLESMKRSIRTSKRSLTSISSSKSVFSVAPSPHKSAFDLPSIIVEKSPRPNRTHRRTQSDSQTLDFDESVDNSRLVSSTKMATSTSTSLFRTPESPRQLEVFFGARPSSNNSSPASSRKSSKKSNSSYHGQESHYFFPSLVSPSQPKNLVWDEDSEYGYGFSWSLIPHEGDNWFLSPKFITITLFRLLFSFAPRQPNQKPSSMERMCMLWRRGISWCDPVGARVCVAISDDNKITLSMQCMRGYEMACLSIRNEIMADIKQQLAEIHPGICPREIFTPYDGVSVFPVIDPLNSYVSFDRDEIRLAIIENRLATCTHGKHLKPVESLLYFEPLCYLTPELLEELLDKQNERKQITDDFCMQFAKKLSTKWTYLASHFTDTVIKKYFIDSLKEDALAKRAPHDMAMVMLSHLKVADYGEECKRADTYSGLQRSLFEISVFSPHELVDS